MNLLRKLRYIPDPLLQESKDFLANINAAGGGIRMESLVSCDRFIRSCMAAGIWTKLIEVYPLCGNDLTSALVKLKYTSNPLLTSVNFVAADFTERGTNAGIVGNGSTKYLNTNFPQNGLPNAAHMSLYMRTPESVGSFRYWFQANTATDWASLGTTNGTNSQALLGGSSIAAAGLNNPTAGFYYTDRSSNSLIELYYNNVFAASNNGVTIPNYGNVNLFALARNNNNSGPVGWTAQRFSFFSVGATMTANERTAFYNAVVALQTALERNV